MHEFVHWSTSRKYDSIHSIEKNIVIAFTFGVRFYLLFRKLRENYSHLFFNPSKGNKNDAFFKRLFWGYMLLSVLSTELGRAHCFHYAVATLLLPFYSWIYNHHCHPRTTIIFIPWLECRLIQKGRVREGAQSGGLGGLCLTPSTSICNYVFLEKTLQLSESLSLS